MLVGSPYHGYRALEVASPSVPPSRRETHAQGADILLTPHPCSLLRPALSLIHAPSGNGGHAPGAVVRRACGLGLSILSFHTALDVTAGLDALPVLFAFNASWRARSLPGAVSKGGLGVYASSSGDEPLTLRHLSARCVSVFGTYPPRVGISRQAAFSRIVTSGGSAVPLPACASTRALVALFLTR